MKGPTGEILTHLVIDKYNLQGTVGLFQKISKFSPPHPKKGIGIFWGWGQVCKTKKFEEMYML